jgi:hypothetical protein
MSKEPKTPQKVIGDIASKLHRAFYSGWPKEMSAVTVEEELSNR